MSEAPRRISGLTGLLMVVLPFILFVFAEITVLIAISKAIGWWTLPLMLASTVLGGYLLQREWRKAWQGLSDSLKTGSLPPGRTADAVLVLVGGILLIMPGFITDVVGLLLLLPFTRPMLRSALGWWAGRALQKAERKSGGPVVIKGEVVEEPPTSLIPGIIEPPRAPETRSTDEGPEPAGR